MKGFKILWLIIVALFCFIGESYIYKHFATSNYFNQPFTSTSIFEKKGFPCLEFPASSLDKARQLLADSGVRKAFKTKDELRDLELFIYTCFEAKHPSIHILNAVDSLGELAVFQQAYNSEMAEECGHYGKTLNLFCTALGNKSRPIGVHYIPDTSIGEHTFTEVYLPTQKKYIYTDMTFNILCIDNNRGVPYGADEVYQKLSNKDTSNMVFHFIDSNKYYLTDKAKLFRQLFSCYNQETKMDFYTLNNFAYRDNTAFKRLKTRYLFHPSAHYLWGKGVSNFYYYLRIGLMIMGIFFCFWLLKAVVNSRK